MNSQCAVQDFNLGRQIVIRDKPLLQSESFTWNTQAYCDLTTLVIHINNHNDESSVCRWSLPWADGHHQCVDNWSSSPLSTLVRFTPLTYRHMTMWQQHNPRPNPCLTGACEEPPDAVVLMTYSKGHRPGWTNLLYCVTVHYHHHRGYHIFSIVFHE